MKRLLVANPGQIAVRIIRAAKDLGLETVAVHSETDAGAAHVRLADTAMPIGPSLAGKSDLRPDAIVEAAVEAGADAVHPGYGFLSERAGFAQACEAAGLTFVGPDPATIDTMGDKVAARAAGLPTVPGSDARHGGHRDQLRHGPGRPVGAEYEDTFRGCGPRRAAGRPQGVQGPHPADGASRLAYT